MKYKVKNTAIEYKGEIYKSGSIIELEEKDAKSLIENDFLKKLTIVKKTREAELKELTVLELKELALNMSLELEVTKKSDIIEAIIKAKNEV